MAHIRRLSKATVVISLMTIVSWQLMTARTAADLTHEQQEAVWTDFSNTDKAFGLTSKVLQEAMGNEATQDLLERYGAAVMIIQVEKELYRSGDLSAAAIVISNKLSDKVLERVAPGFHSWLGWITWAKTGLELFKDFIFDPMVEQSQIDTYVGMREAGNDPLHAYAGVRGDPYAIERAKKEYRKLYGDHVFKSGTNDLLPAWQSKFQEFINATYERHYQNKLLREIQQRAAVEAAEAEKQLPELRARLALLLEQYRVKQILVEPAEIDLAPGKQQTFSATAIYQGASAERSAEIVTGEAEWSGGTYDNVIEVLNGDLGKTITITAKYGGLAGMARVHVTEPDCGDYGRYNFTTGKCDCDSGYAYHDILEECVAEDGAMTDEVKSVLGDLEHDFYDAVTLFDEHYKNFIALLLSYGAGSSEDICADPNIAFSFTRAAAYYEMINDFYFSALEMVGRGETGMNWDAIAVGNYATDVSVADQIRLEMFRKDYQRVRDLAEGMPDELFQFAPECDPEDLLDIGARTAETDQDAETGVDGVITDGTGGSIGGVTADFAGSPLSGDPPLQVQFADLSTGDEIVSWEWSFGDGGGSSLPNPSHTYFDDGTYPVSLKVTDSEGQSDTETKPNYIQVGDGGGGTEVVKFVSSGSIIQELQDQSSCNGGSVSLELSNISFPSEIRSDAVSSVSFVLDLSYSGFGDRGAAGVVYFLNVIREIDLSYLTGNGPVTISFSINPEEIDFTQQAGSVLIQVGAGMMCEDQTNASASVQSANGYVRQGGN